MTQSTYLDGLERELREVLQIVRTRLATQSGPVLLQRRQPDAWNIQETFAHLNAYLEYYLPHIERAIHKAKARNWPAAAEVQHNWVDRRAIARVQPGSAPRKSPKKYNFLHLKVEQDEIKRFLINSERLIRNVQAAREISLNRPRLPGPFFPHWKFTLGGVFQYLIAHAQRHTLQAQNLLT
jgi:hypothetical protein